LHEDYVSLAGRLDNLDGASRASSTRSISSTKAPVRAGWTHPRQRRVSRASTGKVNAVIPAVRFRPPQRDANGLVCLLLAETRRCP
jgi:hypothetical protein